MVWGDPFGRDDSTPSPLGDGPDGSGAPADEVGARPRASITGDAGGLGAATDRPDGTAGDAVGEATVSGAARPRVRKRHLPPPGEAPDPHAPPPGPGALPGLSLPVPDLVLLPIVDAGAGEQSAVMADLTECGIPCWRVDDVERWLAHHHEDELAVDLAGRDGIVVLAVDEDAAWTVVGDEPPQLLGVPVEWFDNDEMHEWSAELAAKRRRKERPDRPNVRLIVLALAVMVALALLCVWAAAGSNTRH